MFQPRNIETKVSQRMTGQLLNENKMKDVSNEKKQDKFIEYRQ